MTAEPIGPGTVLGGRYRLDAPLPDPADPAADPDRPGAPPASFWRATDTVLSRTVAIHVVAAADPRGPSMVEAARMSAAVTDPHLLRVLDCDERDGAIWVVNEWAEGATLAAVLDSGPLAPERAARVTREVAEALAAAHAAGVAHGSLAPESVLLTDTGGVRLIGFAVTAALAQSDPADGPPAFLPGAPRQSVVDGSAEGAPAGRGADRWGYDAADPIQADVVDLAALLYAALTGRWAGIAPSALPPAPGDARGPLRPRQVRAGVPRMLDTLCERVLRREAHEHVLPVETAHEVLAALTDEVGGQDTALLEADVEDALALGALGTAGAGWTGTTTATGPAVPVPTPHPPPAVPVTAGPAPQAGVEPTVVLPEPVDRDATDPDATQAALSLPPFDDGSERPLFASTDRRPPDRARGSSAWLYGDAATGTLDPVTDGPPPGVRPRSTTWGPGGTGRRAGAVLGALVLLVAMVVAFELGRGGHSSTTARPPADKASATPVDTVITPTHVRDFDPDGNPSTENPAEVPLATDGKPGTGWTTMTYTRPALGNLKPGVGLLVDLGADRSVGSVHLQLGGTPTDLALYASPVGTRTAPANVTDMRRVAVDRGAGATVTLRPHTALRTRYLVVWLTSLPPVGGGYRGEIDEMTIRS